LCLQSKFYQSFSFHLQFPSFTFKNLSTTKSDLKLTIVTTFAKVCLFLLNKTIGCGLYDCVSYLKKEQAIASREKKILWPGSGVARKKGITIDYLKTAKKTKKSSKEN